jgi:hypothetical protein
MRHPFGFFMLTNSGTRKSKVKSIFDLRSLPVQMITSVIVMVLLTAVTVGNPFMPFTIDGFA